MKGTAMERGFLKNIFRNAVLAAGYYSGIFEIFRMILSKRGYVPILVYHSVQDRVETDTGKSSFYLRGLAVSSAQFEDQIAYLDKRYKVISLTEYIDRRKRGEALNSCAVITFDDGFKDSAVTILSRYQFPATVFITPSFLKKLYWRHLVDLLFDHAQTKDVEFKMFSGETIHFLLNSDDEKIASISKIIVALSGLPENKRDALIDELRKILGVKEVFKLENVYFTADEIKALSGKGLDFGAHSSTHANLAHLNDEDLKKEIKDSWESVRVMTGEEKIPFAIPFGRYDKRTLNAIKEQGFICSLTSSEGLNKDEDIYKLKRLGITARTLPEFAFRTSGTGMLFQEIGSACRVLIVSLMKRLDKITGHIFGDIIRKMTNVNRPKYWDGHYSRFDTFVRDFPYRFLINFLPKGAGFSLLDIGCGLGEGCELLKRAFPSATIYGSDFSPLAIEKARSKKNEINYFILDIGTQDPPHKYDFISLVHILEHFNDPFAVLDRCLKYVKTAVLIITPYIEKIDDPRLYSKGEHRYLFNEHTFSKYTCTVLNTTDIIPAAGSRYIVYRIEP